MTDTYSCSNDDRQNYFPVTIKKTHFQDLQQTT